MSEIEDMKHLLIEVAEKYDFDFQHPDVIMVSQELDLLIIEAMKA
ncbi:aspartyl-phosphate phosphatase Spo0E family protein [Aneurinibacillus sp. REN35]